MKKNKIILVLVITLCLLCFTGCKSETEKAKSKLSVINCTRSGTIDDSDSSTDLSYKIYYKGDYIQILNSKESVKSTNSEVLDEYETAYKKIFSYYDGLEYYDNTIIRTTNSVTSDTTINYAKIDIDKLLEIEGSEDNVIEDGKVKVKTWLSFAKKYGAECDD